MGLTLYEIDAKLQAAMDAAETEASANEGEIKEMESLMKNIITCPKCGHEFTTERK